MAIKRIRVLHLIDQLGTGGAQRDVVSLCEHLNRDKCEQAVWALHGSNATMAEQVLQTGVPVSYLGHSRWDPLIFPRLVSRLRRIPFDVLHTHVNMSALFGILANRLARRVPILVTVDASRFQMTLVSFWFFYGFPSYLADAALIDAPDFADELAGVGVPRSRIRQIRYGNALIKKVEEANSSYTSDQYLAFRQQWRLGDGDRLLVSVARLHPERKCDLFLTALAEVVRRVPNVRLMLVGNGPAESDLRLLASRLGILDRVIFAGFQADALPFYRAADLFLTLSIGNYVAGLAPQEAMVCGTPVVAFSVNKKSMGMAARVVDDGQVFVKAASLPGFTQAIHDLLTDETRRKDIGRRGKEAAWNYGTPEERARQHEHLYEELVGRRKKA